MKQGLVRLLYNFGKRFMGWTLHMIMCVLCYPLSIHMSQLLSTGRPISSYQIILKARHIPGCLNVMADLLSRSNQVQSTEWSLHLQVFKQICQKWFTPHVDLFATCLNHKVPLYVSPVPDQNAWDIDALNINWSGLTAYAYPTIALLHRVIQKIRQCNCLIIAIAPGWPGMPWL